MSKLAALIQKDARGIYRDGFLMSMALYPLLIALAIRLLVPWIPIEHIELYLAPAVVLTASMLIGSVLGFALIEERENRTSLLLRVLPLSQGTLFTYLATSSSLLSLAASLAGALIYGQAVVEPLAFLLVATVGALFAPLVMLTLGAAASNKIEGLALSKLISTTAVVPALAFVLPPSWQLLLTWHPVYWLYLGLLRAYAGDAALPSLAIHWPGFAPWTFVLAPLVLSLLGIACLVRIYRRRVD